VKFDAVHLGVHIRRIIARIELQVHVELMNQLWIDANCIKNVEPPIFVKDLENELKWGNPVVRS
jgi:hypothetical protein